MEQDLVFKALADPHRRTLLDALFQRDGQTLTDLCAHLPMTRYGVMKHLHVLEEAGLVTTHKEGREKHHYLNVVPIQAVYERWVSKFAQPWAEALIGLKTVLEDQAMENRHVFQVFIQTTPQQLWRALTASDLTRQYYFGSAVVSDWQPGSPYCYPNPAGGTYVTGKILVSDPPRRLSMTFQPDWQYPDETPPVSHITWEIEQLGTACKLTLTHEQLDVNSQRGKEIIAGWTQIISGLKTLLETGQPLVIND